MIATAQIGIRRCLEQPRCCHYFTIDPLGRAETRSQCWGVTGPVGGFVLATVTTLGGISPALTWGTLAVLAGNRFLMPGFKIGKTEEANDKNVTTTKNRTRKAVDMGKSTIRNLAIAAPITVLFNTVGIGALSL